MWKYLFLLISLKSVIGLDFLGTAADCKLSKIHLDHDGQDFLRCIVANSAGQFYCERCETKFMFNLNERNEIKGGTGASHGPCQYFEFSNVNAIYLDARQNWAAGKCLKCDRNQTMLTMPVHYLPEEQCIFYDAYQKANKCFHDHIDDLDAADAVCLHVFRQYRNLFFVGQQHGKCRNSDELIRSLNTESSIFTDDNQLVSQIQYFPYDDWHDGLPPAAPLFFLFAAIIFAIILLLIFDFLYAYRKNRVLSINYNQHQQQVV